MSKICKHCGAELDNGALFCFNCKNDPDKVWAPREKEALEKEKRKTARKKAIISTIIAVLVIAAVVGIVIFVTFVKGEINRGKEEDQKNLELLDKVYPGYLNTPYYNLLKKEYENLHEEDRPEKVNTLIILRDEKDGQSILGNFKDAHSDYSIPNGVLTEEGAEKIDVIVYAVSSYRTATYEGGGRYAELSSEDVDLYYYNTKTRSYFSAETIEGKPLPDHITKTLDYTIDVNKIKERVFSELNVEIDNSFGWIFWVVFLVGTILTFGILGIVVLVKRRKENNEKLARKLLEDARKDAPNNRK